MPIPAFSRTWLTSNYHLYKKNVNALWLLQRLAWLSSISAKATYDDIRANRGCQKIAFCMSQIIVWNWKLDRNFQYWVWMIYAKKKSGPRNEVEEEEKKKRILIEFEIQRNGMERRSKHFSGKSFKQNWVHDIFEHAMCFKKTAIIKQNFQIILRGGFQKLFCCLAFSWGPLKISWQANLYVGVFSQLSKLVVNNADLTLNWDFVGGRPGHRADWWCWRDKPVTRVTPKFYLSDDK